MEHTVQINPFPPVVIKADGNVRQRTLVLASGFSLRTAESHVGEEFQKFVMEFIDTVGFKQMKKIVAVKCC